MFKPKVKTSLNQFINMIHKWRKESKSIKHYDLLKLVLDESGYSGILKNKKDMRSLFFKSLWMCFLLLSYLANNAQTSKVWVTIREADKVPYYQARTRLVSNDSVFNHYINSLNQAPKVLRALKYFVN